MNPTNNPFRILLDTYQEESEEFYIKVLKQVKYVSPLSSVGQTKQRLLKCAFAYMCMEYLNTVNDDMYFDDLPLFIEEMALEKKLPEIYYLMGKENIKWELAEALETNQINEGLFFDLIQVYIKWWGKEIKDKYSANTNFYALFSDNIFGENEGPYGIDVANNAMEYIDSLIR